MKFASCNMSNIKYINPRSTISFGDGERDLVNSITSGRNDIDIFIPPYPTKIRSKITAVLNSYAERVAVLENRIKDIDTQDYRNAYFLRDSDEFQDLFKTIELCNKPATRPIMIDKESGLFKLYESLDRLYDKTMFGMYKANPDNCIMVVSKDKNIAERFIDFVNFHIKSRQKFSETHRGFNFDYIKLSENPDNDDLQEAIGEALEKAEEHYKKTGRETLLHVPDMERLCHPDNGIGNIACMKEMMNTCGNDYHTTMIFSAKDPSILDPGTMVSHRIGYKAVLDDSITMTDFKHFDELSAQYAPYMEKRYKMIDEYFAEVTPLAKEAENLQKECKTKVEELCSQAEESIKKNKNLKKGILIATGIAAAVGLSVLIYKKLKQNNKKTIEQAPSVKNITNANQYLPNSANRPMVFSKF